MGVVVCKVYGRRCNDVAGYGYGRVCGYVEWATTADGRVWVCKVPVRSGYV